MNEVGFGTLHVDSRYFEAHTRTLSQLLASSTMSERAQDDVANPPNVQGQNVQNTPPTTPSPHDVDGGEKPSKSFVYLSSP